MASRLPNPFPHWVDSTGAPYAGGRLTFYASNSSTPLAVYSEETLSSSLGTFVDLNSAGRPSTAIFLQNLPYKVVLTDSGGSEIWTADPVYASDFATFSIRKVGSGSPNGVVAGTAGSSGVLPTEYWDYTNAILYECTTTGSASTAVWTAINSSAATAVVTPPQGYLTLQTATPILTGDVTAATSVYYTPFIGNQVPFYNGSRFVPTEFTELTLALVANHSANTIYDIFGFLNSGVPTLVTGPAWTTSTAGSGARGSGAGTTQIARINGIYVNSVAIVGRNGSTTYSIGANLATYLGTLLVDSAAGQATCHLSYGQGRRWALWNAYNRQKIVIKVGSTAGYSINVSTALRYVNADSAHSALVFRGLPEVPILATYRQQAAILSNNGTASLITAIGVDAVSSTGKLSHRCLCGAEQHRQTR